VQRFSCQRGTNPEPTTTFGILTILAAVINAALAVMQGNPVDLPATVTAITAGIGLIKAADAK